jgi:hypothetical protein
MLQDLLQHMWQAILHLLIRKQGLLHKSHASNRIANAEILSSSFCFWHLELGSLLRPALDSTREIPAGTHRPFFYIELNR